MEASWTCSAAKRGLAFLWPAKIPEHGNSRGCGAVAFSSRHSAAPMVPPRTIRDVADQAKGTLENVYRCCRVGGRSRWVMIEAPMLAQTCGATQRGSPRGGTSALRDPAM